jgi:hypothetical protein
MPRSGPVFSRRSGVGSTRLCLKTRSGSRQTSEHTANSRNSGEFRYRGPCRLDVFKQSLACYANQLLAKFFSSFSPSAWLFSGWNWVATRLSRQTIEQKGRW